MSPTLSAAEERVGLVRGVRPATSLAIAQAGTCSGSALRAVCRLGGLRSQSPSDRRCHPRIEDARNRRCQEWPPPVPVPGIVCPLGTSLGSETGPGERCSARIPRRTGSDQMPPINRGAVWIGSKRKAALVGDVALANGSRRNSPGRHSAILLSCTHGTGKVEEVGRPRLRELHQRAVRAYALVTFCDRLKEYVANLGGDQRHGEISHQAFVFHRQSGHRLVLPAATGRWPSRSGPGVLNCALRTLAQRGMCGRRFSLRCGDRRRCRMDAQRGR